MSHLAERTHENTAEGLAKNLLFIYNLWILDTGFPHSSLRSERKISSRK